MFLPFLEGNLFCGPLSRTKRLILRRGKRRLVQIHRERNSQSVGHNKELWALCFSALSRVCSVCAVSSGANEILEDCGAAKFYLQVSGPALSRVCSWSCVLPGIALVFARLLRHRSDGCLSSPSFNLSLTLGGNKVLQLSEGVGFFTDFFQDNLPWPARPALCSSRESSIQISGSLTLLSSHWKGNWFSKWNFDSLTHSKCIKHLTFHI